MRLAYCKERDMHRITGWYSVATQKFVVEKWGEKISTHNLSTREFLKISQEVWLDSENGKCVVTPFIANNCAGWDASYKEKP